MDIIYLSKEYNNNKDYQLSIEIKYQKEIFGDYEIIKRIPKSITYKELKEILKEYNCKKLIIQF